MKNKLKKINSLKLKTVYKYGSIREVHGIPQSDPTTITYGTVSTLVFKVWLIAANNINTALQPVPIRST